MEEGGESEGRMEEGEGRAKEETAVTAWFCLLLHSG